MRGPTRRPWRLGAERGLSLVEVMVTLIVTSLLAIFVLALARSQLSSFRVSDEVQRVQQSARAGFSFIEPFLRDACSSIRSGSLYVNLGNRPGGTATRFQTTCFRHWSGRVPAEGNATAAGGSFISMSPTERRERADAVEIVYGTNRGVATAIVPATHASGLPLILGSVTDTTGFRPGDYLLVTNDFVAAQLVGPVVSVDAATRTIVTEALPMKVAAGSTQIATARTVAFYVGDLADGETLTDIKEGVLMYDPDGLAGATHADAVPLIEGVEDFQIAVGDDARNCPTCTRCNGVLDGTDAGVAVDQWLGNDPNADEPLPDPDRDAGAPMWGVLTCDATTPVALRAIRASLLLRGRNEYTSGTTAGPMLIEDRNTYTVTGPTAPKLRALQIEVMPRTWNLNE